MHVKNIFPTDSGQPVSLYTMSNSGFYSKLYFTMNSLEHRQCVTLLNNIFVYNFHYIYFPKTIPSKIYYHCIAALYINTTVSFKSSITKTYHFWPPIFDPI